MAKHSLNSLRRQAQEHQKQSELFNELRAMTLEELASSQEENAALRLQLNSMATSQSTSLSTKNTSHHMAAEDALTAIMDQDSSGEDSIGPVIITSDILNLDSLPDEIQSIDSGMSALQAIKSAPMRFILLDSFLSWSNLIVYEEVKASDMMEIPYDEVDDDMWGRSAVLSWRWHASKPWTYDQYLSKPGFTPMSQEQFVELQGALMANRSYVDRIWIDCESSRCHQTSILYLTPSPISLLLQQGAV